MFRKIKEKLKYAFKFIGALAIRFLWPFFSDDEDGEEKVIRAKVWLKDQNDLIKEIDNLLMENPKDVKKYERKLKLISKELPETEEFIPVRKKIEEIINLLNNIGEVKDYGHKEVDIRNLENDVVDKEEIILNKNDGQKYDVSIKTEEKKVIKLEEKKVVKVKEEANETVSINKKNVDRLIEKRSDFSFEEKKSDVLETKKNINHNYIKDKVELGNDLSKNKKTEKKLKQEKISSSIIIVKTGPKQALKVRKITNRKTAGFQQDLTIATMISKEIDSNVKKQEHINKKTDDKLNVVNKLISQKKAPKSKILLSNLFRNRVVRNLFKVSILSHSLTASLNLLNNTNNIYQRVSFLTLISKKKRKRKLKEITLKNISDIQKLRLSIKKAYYDKVDDYEVVSILTKLDNMEDNLIRQYEKNFSKDKPKVKKLKLFH
ncbi:MAG: hypothetical protein IJ093_00950 [Bacilli bacterium]|nr:hypothetical protein [Bacilli bacterium]